MQQVLSNPGMIEKFIHTEAHVSLLRECFAGLYSLDEGDNPEQIIKKVLSNPSAYVMKPQREGGGNLLYDTTMTNALNSMSPSQRAAYIIMDKIVPKSVNTYVILKSGNLAVMDGISEIGVYGVFLGNHKKVFLNSFAGTLVRTKSKSDADGGVCAGVAVLDSPYLV